MRSYAKYFILALIGLWLLGFFYMLMHSSKPQNRLEQQEQQEQQKQQQRGFIDYNDSMKKKRRNGNDDGDHDEPPFVLDNGDNGQMSDVWIRRLKQAESELQRLEAINAKNEAIILKLQ
jgi:hypothetical protein